MLIPVSRLFFHIVLQNIGYDARCRAARGSRLLACQCALFSYCCSRACKFKAARTIPRPVPASAATRARDRQRGGMVREILKNRHEHARRDARARRGDECLRGIRALA